MDKTKSVKYIHSTEVHNLSAPNVVVPHLIKLFNPLCVVDVGCGLGTFLYVFKEHGVKEVLGIDGNWVQRDKLLLDAAEFQEADLEKPLVLNKEFDLVVCLEVAEHLKEASADIFIKGLCSLGKVIVFSAAVPNQGGQNHINEQNFSYWQEKFSKHSFSFYDIFRKEFWNNREIEWWYKQNMFLVAHDSIIFSDEIKNKKIEGPANVFIHPDLLTSSLSYISAKVVEEAIRNGRVSIKAYLQGILMKMIRIIRIRKVKSK